MCKFPQNIHDLGGSRILINSVIPGSSFLFFWISSTFNLMSIFLFQILKPDIFVCVQFSVGKMSNPNSLVPVSELYSTCYTY